MVVVEKTVFILHRSTHWRCSIEKGVLKTFVKFTGKHLCQSLRPTALLKKRHWHNCFLVNFAKFLRKPFLQNTSGRLLLIALNLKFLIDLICNFLNNLNAGMGNMSESWNIAFGKKRTL